MQVQPANLGLATLGTDVLSSDSNGSKLQPVLGAQADGSPSYAQGYAYSATISINQSAGNNTDNGGIPNWQTITAPGDVEPNFGGVGLNSGTYGANASITSNYPSGIQQLTAFAGTSASYAQATEFFDSLRYQAKSSGNVTLTPQILPSYCSYWSLLTPGSSSAASMYQATVVWPSNVGNLPVLVISIGTGGHSIVSLAAGTSPGSNYGSNIPPGLTLPSSQITGLNVTTGSVAATGWTVASETEELFGLDILYNGAQATSSQLSALITAINSGDANVPANTSGLVASYDSPTQIPFGAPYNLLLTYDGPGFGTADDLGIDLSTANDPLMAGYTVAAVAVVPEPISLSILAFGGMALMARRSRRKN
jgi:hypothetical protein